MSKPSKKKDDDDSSDDSLGPMGTWIRKPVREQKAQVLGPFSQPHPHVPEATSLDAAESSQDSFIEQDVPKKKERKPAKSVFFGKTKIDEITPEQMKNKTVDEAIAFFAKQTTQEGMDNAYGKFLKKWSHKPGYLSMYKESIKDIRKLRNRPTKVKEVRPTAKPELNERQAMAHFAEEKARQDDVRKIRNSTLQKRIAKITPEKFPEIIPQKKAIDDTPALEDFTAEREIDRRLKADRSSAKGGRLVLPPARLPHFRKHLKEKKRELQKKRFPKHTLLRIDDVHEYDAEPDSDQRWEIDDLVFPDPVIDVDDVESSEEIVIVTRPSKQNTK